MLRHVSDGPSTVATHASMRIARCPLESTDRRAHDVREIQASEKATINRGENHVHGVLQMSSFVGVAHSLEVMTNAAHSLTFASSRPLAIPLSDFPVAFPYYLPYGDDGGGVFYISY